MKLVAMYISALLVLLTLSEKHPLVFIVVGSLMVVPQLIILLFMLYQEVMK